MVLVLLLPPPPLLLGSACSSQKDNTQHWVLLQYEVLLLVSKGEQLRKKLDARTKAKNKQGRRTIVSTQ